MKFAETGQEFSVNPETARQINEAVDLRWYFGPHGTSNDAKKVIPWIQQADIVIPEVVAHNQHIAEGLNLAAATKEAKADFTPEQAIKAKWIEKNVVSPYYRTILGKLRNSGKEVALIDVDYTHPMGRYGSSPKPSVALFDRLLDGTNNHDLAETIGIVQDRLPEFTSVLRDRELQIRSNLFNILLDVTNRQLEQRQNVLVILGTAHNVTADWFLEQGIESTRNDDSSREQRKLDRAALMAQKAIAGAAITREDVADTIVAGLFTQASKAYSQEVKSRLQKKEVAGILYTRFSELFSYEEKEQLWDAPDAKLGDVFDQIFLAKGVTPQEIVDQQT